MIEFLKILAGVSCVVLWAGIMASVNSSLLFGAIVALGFTTAFYLGFHPGWLP